MIEYGINKTGEGLQVFEPVTLGFHPGKISEKPDLSVRRLERMRCSGQAPSSTAM